VRPLLAALGVLALAFLLSTRLPAQAAAGISFSGTTWTSIAHDGGSGSTIHFNADGTWTEIWRDQHQTGHWQVNAANDTVTVLRSDSKIFHYYLKPDHHLSRKPGKVVYALTGSLT
jgi:hypothetical protein